MILSFSSVSQDRFGSTESIPIHRKWFQLQIDKLVGSLKYRKEEKNKITKYIKKYNEFDLIAKNISVLKSDSPDYKQSKEQLENISDEILEMLKSDIETNNKQVDF